MRTGKDKKPWIRKYLSDQKKALDFIPVEAVERVIETLAAALRRGRHIFIFGNGGSAANASHFATDLGKSASDAVGERFRVLSLTDNVSWITALGNDYNYGAVFTGQLKNEARPGDVAIAVSVSGSSPNAVKALAWAKKQKLSTVALVGGKRGKLAEISDEVIAIQDMHYGRVEDAEMSVLHMLCYAFIEHPEWAKG